MPSTRGARLSALLGRALSSFSALGGPLGEEVANAVYRRLHVPIERWCEGRSVVRVNRLGLSWELDLEDVLQRYVYFVGVHESNVLREVMGRLKPSDVVLDVGANVGFFSAPVAKRLEPRAGGRCIAVEPNSEACARLRRNVEANRIDKTVSIVECALGSSAGTASLTRSSGEIKNLGVGFLSKRPASDGIAREVRVECGDDVLNKQGVEGVDVVKIDVEGWEYEVLTGLERVLDQKQPRLLVVELVEGHMRRAGKEVGDVVELLRGRGFWPFKIRARGLEEWAPGWEGNVLFMPERKGKR